jgi:integrase
MPQTHPGSAQPGAALRPVTADALPPLRAPRLLYGTGMRISEALQLRVKDVDFSH